MAVDQHIVRAAIHPAIGIARVGNSQDDYVIGPELPYATPAPQDGYKDAAGALKRQAARFRIYGYNVAGEVVKELTAAEAEIRWMVHVANKKAAWYNFEVALDIPEAQTVRCARRNLQLSGDQRQHLVIDPGGRSIHGTNQQGAAYHFDTGQFMGQSVNLGELRTDEAGRLLFLGGHGSSDSVPPHQVPVTFANNDHWYDDTSDGPVAAEVVLNGTALPVEPAWVIVAPPNYAPDNLSVQTMYDVMYDTFLHTWLQPPPKVSFTHHIYPILRQFYDAQWVNYGFHVQFGWGAPHNFLRPEYFTKLASQQNSMDLEYAEVRRQLFNFFRKPDFPVLDVNDWPPMYGDNMDSKMSTPRALMALTKTQYGFLEKWAAGDFVADWQGSGHLDIEEENLPQGIQDVPLQRQPATLDQAALFFCLGGPFHPGCEMTWPMRHISMYSKPFRIRRRPADQPEPDYGDWMTPAIALSPQGPLTASGPGDITRWMAVPWQTDTASCRAGYQKQYDPYLPTFWAARVPNHVLREAQYATVMDTHKTKEERLLAFNQRAVWDRFLRADGLNPLQEMVTKFGRLGVVERRPGPGDGNTFPAVIYVESEVGFKSDPPAHQNLQVSPEMSALRFGPNRPAAIATANLVATVSAANAVAASAVAVSEGANSVATASGAGGSIVAPNPISNPTLNLTPNTAATHEAEA